MPTDFWTVYHWVDVIAISIPVLLFAAWVLYTDRKIARRVAAAQRQIRRSAG
jgi:hypothetical protein